MCSCRERWWWGHDCALEGVWSRGRPERSASLAGLSPAQTWTQGVGLAVGVGGESREVRGRQTPAAFSTEGIPLLPS